MLLKHFLVSAPHSTRCLDLAGLALVGLRARRLLTLFCLLLVAAVAHAAPSQAVSATTLTATAGAVPAVSVPAQTVITLTASVLSGGASVAPGLVNFCDATAIHCTGAHLVGSAQLMPSGSAVYKFVPGPGTHSYKAVFIGTNTYAGSTSLPVPLTVSSFVNGASAVGIQADGGQGDYDLLGTVAPTGALSPTGQVSFLDTTNANYPLGSATVAATGAGNPSFLRSFSYQFPLGSGVRPGYVATGDFNNDGHQDILFVSDLLGAVYTLLGNGDGTFKSSSFPLAVASQEPPLVADFNGDGKLDFIVRTKTGLAVYLGNGDGTFTAGPTLPNTGSFAVADLNNDGIPDLLIGTSGAYDTYLGDGKGGFGSPILAFQGNISTIGTLTADFNGDGNVDVLLLSAFGNLQVLLGNGDGTFRSGPASPVPGNSLGSGGVGVAPGAVGDLNGDGVVDVVIPEGVGSTPPFVLLGNGDGTFNILPRDGHLTSASNAVTLADFNGDGTLDVVFPYLYGGATNVYIGKGDGTFTPDIYSPGLAYFTSESVAAADFNGDGQADLAEVFNGDYNEVVVLLSQPASTAAGYAHNISPVGTGYHYVAAYYPGDANNPAGTSQTIALLAQQVPTNLTLTALPGGGSLQGQTVTLTANLDQFFAQNHSASGTVTFTNNGNTVGTAQVTNGTAVLTTSTLAAGPGSLQAEYAGDTNFEDSASAPLTYPVTQIQTQTITFPAPLSPAYDDTSVTLAAASSSGLPITYQVLSGPATVTGSTLTYTGVGLVTVQASQAGNGTFAAAPPVTTSVTTQLITGSVGMRTGQYPTVLVFTASGTIANVNITTQGAPSLDFILDNRGHLGGTECLAGMVVTAGQTCTLRFDFGPTHPGPRFGGITLTDANGNLLANSYVLGSGIGPQLFYVPPTQSTVGSGFGYLSGAAVDGFGNLYLSDKVAGIYEVPAATGATSLVLPLAGAADVIVDGSGNVFAISTTTVIEIAAVNGVLPPNPTSRTLATGFYNLDGVKVDANGNVFVADGGNGLHAGGVSELLAVNGVVPTNPVTVAIGSGYGVLTGVAVDVNGNVFASDQQNHAIFEVLAVNGVIPPNPTMKTVGSGFSVPTNVAFDGVGDLFVPDAGTHTIREVLAVNGVIPANPTIVDLGSGLVTPQGLVIDPSGNVFIADSSIAQATELNYGVPPTLTFASTTVNSLSSDSPRSFTITNAGNADLVFPAPAAGTNPTINSSFSIDATSGCPSLAPGSAAFVLHATQACTTAVDFRPAAIGPVTGTLVRTDDNLNIQGSTQTVNLVGNGLAIVPVITFAVPGHTFGDPAFPVAATSTSSAPITYTVVSGQATIAGATVTLTGAGAVTLQAAQQATGNYAAATATATFNVAKKAQTITFAALASPVAFTAAPIALTASASSGLPVVFSILSGPGRVSGSTLIVTGGGTIVVAADQPGDASYAAAAQVTRNVIVLYGTPVVTLAAAPNPVFVLNPVTLSAAVTAPTGTPAGNVTFFDGTTPIGVGGISGGGASIATAGLAVGSHSITAVYGGDANFASATSPAVIVLVEDFSLTITNPNLTIQHGGTGVFHFVVSSVGGAGLASTITLTTGGEPGYSTYSFAPAIIGSGTGTTNGTLTIHTPDFPSGPFYSGRLETGGAVTALATLLGLMMPARRRRRSLLAGMLLLLGMLGSASLLSGCGSGWKTQHWYVTVTATSGALSRTANATLTSQP